MRLIDADKLKPTTGMFIYQTEDRDTVVAVEAYRWELIKREASTVNAIPIKWIKEWVERDENYWDYQYLTDVLLKDWEKENAKIDKCR